MMKPGKKSRRLIPLLYAGMLLITCGFLLFRLNTPRRVMVVENGTARWIETARIRVDSILREARIELRVEDHLFPNKAYWASESVPIRINQQKRVTLDDRGEWSVFATHENLVGNMLLDAGRKLYPDDRLFWNNIMIEPSMGLGNFRILQFQIRAVHQFKLITDGTSETLSFADTAGTVKEALRLAKVDIAPQQRITPPNSSPFEDGMVIKLFTPRPLAVSIAGRETVVDGYGSTVGEALMNAGLPLSGWDKSVPAEDAPLPADGRIEIIHVQQQTNLKLQSVPFKTQWNPDDSRTLDDNQIQSSGRNGIQGTVQQVRFENGVQLVDETLPERVFVSPTNAVGTYGTRVETQTIQTADGPLEYWRAIPVYATSYSPCRSGVPQCVNGTASGMKVDIGVIAVDRAWYGLTAGMRVYVPDYGIATIGDTGRSATADHRWIDLAYNDENFVPWSRNTTLYFLTPIPADIP